MKLTRVFPLFSVAFAVIYVFAMEYNFALFTYHPQLKEFGLLVQAPKAGPAMYWYGWIVTSLLGAALVSAIALCLPRQWGARLWTGWTWLIPTAAFVVVVYLLRSYFLR
jgi:hypothetical protein